MNESSHTYEWVISHPCEMLLSRIDEIIGLFCKRALQKRRYSAKETCEFIHPTDHSHLIGSYPLGRHESASFEWCRLMQKNRQENCEIWRSEYFKSDLLLERLGVTWELGSAPTRCVDAAKPRQHVQIWRQAQFRTISCSTSSGSHRAFRACLQAKEKCT